MTTRCTPLRLSDLIWFDLFSPSSNLFCRDKRFADDPAVAVAACVAIYNVAANSADNKTLFGHAGTLIESPSNDIYLYSTQLYSD